MHQRASCRTPQLTGQDSAWQRCRGELSAAGRFGQDSEQAGRAEQCWRLEHCVRSSEHQVQDRPFAARMRNSSLIDIHIASHLTYGAQHYLAVVTSKDQRHC